MPRRGQALAAPIVAFALGLLSATACRMAAGPTLGFYLAPFAFAGFILPGLALAVETNLPRRARIPLLFSAGVSLLWLTTGPASWADAAGCALLLLAVAILCVGLAMMLARLFRSPSLGGALAVVLMLLWLTWPIWLSASLESSAGDRLTPLLTACHPLLAANTLLAPLGIWTQQRVMYHLTTLGQHVSYALPVSIWPCVLSHTFLGAALTLLSFLPKKREGQSIIESVGH